jgi:hypothetical protein
MEKTQERKGKIDDQQHKAGFSNDSPNVGDRLLHALKTLPQQL